MEGFLKDPTTIRLFDGMGRGVSARYNLHHDSVGTTIATCELLVLSDEDTKKVNDTELKHYTFKYNETQDCLVMGIGEMFNHSDTPNVGYRLVDYSEAGEIRKVLEFYLLQPVKIGEQLFIDYNADTRVNSAEYISSKSMIG